MMTFLYSSSRHTVTVDNFLCLTALLYTSFTAMKKAIICLKSANTSAAHGSKGQYEKVIH